MTITARLKPMNPGTADVKYTGSEPSWTEQPAVENRISRLTESFSWYNYHYGRKEARDILVTWLERRDRKSDLKTLRKVGDNDLNLTAAWLCRMNMMGLELTQREVKQLDQRIAQMLETTAITETMAVLDPVIAATKPNIQERLREKLIS